MIADHQMDDLMQMARKAGGFIYTQNLASSPVQVKTSVDFSAKALADFAQLVAKKAVVAEMAKYRWGGLVTNPDGREYGCWIENEPR